VASTGLQRNSSVRSNHARASLDVEKSANIGRSLSTRQKPTPLIDLTPQYREPPQHIKKGKGHYPDQVGPGGLVEAATSPDDPIGAPPAADWRNRNGSHAARPTTSSGAQEGAGIDRSRSLRGHGARLNGPSVKHLPVPGHSLSVKRSHQTIRTNNNDATTGASSSDDGEIRGLLATSNPGWGGQHRGRGVADGAHAKGPMLDLNAESQFAEGSLLRKAEGGNINFGAAPVDRSGR